MTSAHETLKVSSARRAQLEELRLARAERAGTVPSTLDEILNEALFQFLRREWAQPVMWTPKPGERVRPTR